MKKRTFVLAAFVALAILLVAFGVAHADKLSDAIAKAPQGAEAGQIDPTKPVITSYSIHYTKLYDDVGAHVPAHRHLGRAAAQVRLAQSLRLFP